MRREWSLTTLLAATLAGCLSVGPDYEPAEVREPAAALPDQALPEFRSTNTTVIVAETNCVSITESELAQWWRSFGDETLVDLIQTAFASNHTLRAAAQNVRRARALLAAARGKWEPQLDLGGGFARSGTSANGASGASLTRNLYTGGFDAAWEIDIFGGTRRAVEAAWSEYEAECADLDGVWISLAAETGRAYFELRTVQERLAVARDNLKLQQETHDILSSRLKAGIGDDLAVQQARYNVEATRSTIPPQIVAQEELLNTLAVLTGMEPGALHARLLGGKMGELIAPRRLVGIDAGLLRRRPDIRAAERNLAAQSARIGEATADLYPRFFLSGSIGLEALEARDFFKFPGSRHWSFGPSVSWKIFSGNSVRANIDIQDALYEAAAEQYEQTLLTAQKEIRDALMAYVQEFHRYESLLAAVDAATSAVNISKNLYRNGLRDFNNVLDAERSQLELQESCAVSRGQIATRLVALYKALGGGWSPWLDKE